ncbi:MAG: hypothetical protein Q8L45_13015 [Xanthomonadaceae bacterium]|nr:hypothetical protein [Xanthomonadaceae bacterium]MDP2185800.1 hypothetical protein [Xanthomonadales bacterium]MDZ4114649.1 hypothetical protein [Xanthomonadaceae bacterium]MDZ4378227.1 hypothetical protein [Xanthomonadaceae bacterium]
MDGLLADIARKWLIRYIHKRRDRMMGFATLYPSYEEWPRRAVIPNRNQTEEL